MSRNRALPVSSGDSQYEYDSEFGDETDYDSNEEGSTQPTTARSERRASVYSVNSQTDDNDAYLHAADRSMGTLQTLHSTQGSSWKRALKHKSGVVVYVSKEKSYAGLGKKGGSEGYYAPVFKGEHEIKGFSPAAVFGVVGTRKLWDEWYKEGNLVENLSDTASLTYMCMKGIAGSSTRDLSLVEKVAGNATGTILFVSTSVVTPKVPRVAGRVRASIALNGWVLEPTNSGTKVTYYLHVNVKTFIPAFAAMKYLARRPTCIAKIDEYLQSHGSPPMAGLDASQQQNGEVVPIRRRRDSVSSKRSVRSARSQSSTATAAGLPVHVSTNEDSATYGELQKAQKLFKSILAMGQNDWQVVQNQSQSKIWMNKREAGLLPIVKGEALIEGVTTEQVLGTLLSGAARRDWDPRFVGLKTIQLDNAFDQGTYIESHAAIFPTLGPRHYIIARGVDRDDTTNDNGQIVLVSRSIRADAAAPKGSTKGQMDVSGWLIEDHGNGSVKVSHVGQIDVKDNVLPVIERVLASEIALAPHKVAEFINDVGYAPYFVRWGEGPAQLESDSEGDLKKGDAVFRIGGEGTGTMANGQQKCWLQWSERMYERGINLHLSPDDAATISKVEGMERTVELIWNANVKDGAVLTLNAADGDGAEDLYLDGTFLDKTVAMERGSGMKKKAKKEVAVAAVVAAVAAPVAAVAAVAAVASSKAADVKPKVNGVAAPVSRSVEAPVADAPVAQVATEQREDVCLVITKDLSFTRSQVTFMGCAILGAYIWGKM